MVFSANPLSLSVSDPFFDSWLRQNGYPENLEHHTTTATTSTATSTTPSSPTTTATATTQDGFRTFFTSLFSTIRILLSLFTVDPFSKLAYDDFAGPTPPWTTASPPWTVGFFGDYHSYSFPVSVSQARLRVQENVKRYAKNYGILLGLFFICSVYYMRWPVVGVLSSLALWEVFRRYGQSLGLDQYPTLRSILICLAQCVAAIILIYMYVQMALLWTLFAGYAGMILHAGFRTLTRAKETSRRSRW